MRPLVLSETEIAERELANMKRIEDETYEGFVRGIEHAYKTYLEQNQLKDVPVVRIGFYSIIDQIINLDPYPILPVQQRTETYILKQLAEDIDGLTEFCGELLRASMLTTKKS
jgi:hypothetical protein